MTKTNEEKITPVVIRGESVPVIYADGLSQIMIGFPNSRLVLHNRFERITEEDGTKENRYVACELVMPTAAMLDMAQQLIGHVASNNDLLKNVGSEWWKAVTNLLESMDPK